MPFPVNVGLIRATETGTSTVTFSVCEEVVSGEILPIARYEITPGLS